eukprot:scaffold34525_cov58-Cyclotella_meneghiniana.AAC.1
MMRLHHTTSLVFIVASVSKFPTTMSFSASPSKQPLKRPHFTNYQATASTSDPSTATNDCDIVRIREVLKSIPPTHDNGKGITNELLETLGHDRENLVHTIIAAKPDR